MAQFPKRRLMMQTASIAESRLIRQMAWRTIQNFDKPMSKEEREVYGARGKKLVVYIACINDALLDLETELESVGKFRHDVKRRVKQAQEIAMKAHETMWKALDNIEGCNAVSGITSDMRPPRMRYERMYSSMLQTSHIAPQWLF